MEWSRAVVGGSEVDGVGARKPASRRWQTELMDGGSSVVGLFRIDFGASGIGACAGVQWCRRSPQMLRRWFSVGVGVVCRRADARK
jgi:hypothetical protein